MLIARRCWQLQRPTTFVTVTRRSSTPDMGRLLVACADRPGIVAAVSRFLFEHGANIAESGQYSTHPDRRRFFLRVVFHRPGLQAMRDELEQRFAAEVGRPFAMQWRFTDPGVPKRAAIMVSRYDHCLLDLLWRARRDELDLDVGLVISNHADLAARRALLRRSLRPHPGHPRHQGRGRAAPDRAAGRQLRPHRPRALHADPVGRLPRGRRRAGHQHPPLLPAVLRGRRTARSAPTTAA